MVFMLSRGVAGPSNGSTGRYDKLGRALGAGQNLPFYGGSQCQEPRGTSWSNVLGQVI